MKIVILEGATLGIDVDISIFNQLGETVIYDATDYDTIQERIKDANVILTNRIPMKEKYISGAKDLKLICVTGTGTNHIDLNYTKSRGITVCNVGSYSTASVAQHTFAMYFYLTEHLRYYDDYVKSGEYSTKPSFADFLTRFEELNGKTWGIIGLGEIGRRVAKIAEAFGCNVIYYSTSGKNSSTDYQQVDLDTLLKTSDILSIHAPLNDTTRNLIGAKELNKMKKTAILINVARGPIINEEDLYQALKEGTIEKAGLDVFSKEPIKADHPLLSIKDGRKLLLTPHMAWTSIEARTKLIQEIYKNIEAFQKGEKRNVVE
ncbi:MAG TPA: D-2-hydroxyacid dehydrogenase [Candidatus Merdenecus merdavium]|nr:D-2-hydroxyacid dehydrogenase [Candidatus Merdenecus merdavium]